VKRIGNTFVGTATEEEAKGVDRDNPPGEARPPSASERIAFLNATHRVEGHYAKDDEEAKKVDPDNPSRQTTAFPSGNLDQKIDSSMDEKIKRERQTTVKSIEDLKTNVRARIEEVELSQEASIKLIDSENIKINVEVEYSQRTSISRMSLNQKPEKGRQRRVHATTDGQKWRSAGSHRLHRSGRTSISRMSLDQKPQKGRQRRVHATTNGQVSTLIMDPMLEYKFGDKPP
jgi:hypothetical protein